METFHLYHLAKNYVPRPAQPLGGVDPPVATGPVSPTVESTTGGSTQSQVPEKTAVPPPRIRAAAAQMIFASRLSKAFIAPDEVVGLERWSSRGILEALIQINVSANVGGSCSASMSQTWLLIGKPTTLQRCHEEAGSVWEVK
jgi:uridine phosphorylase